MANQTIIRKEKSIETLLRELREINKNLRRFLLIIPKESLKEYKKASEIKKAFAKAVKLYPPK
jgi:vacuolar-type H+-ATPase subunit F/Vma7